MIIVTIAMTMVVLVVLMTYWKQVRLDSSLRAPPGLVKLRQKIQLHTTKLKPTDYVGFSKLPYQVGKQTNKEARIAPSLNPTPGLQTSSETGFLLQPDVGRGVRAGQGLPHQLHVPCGCLPEEGGYKSFHVNYFVFFSGQMGLGCKAGA